MKWTGAITDVPFLPEKRIEQDADQLIGEYPPDLQQRATELVLQQAEVLCNDWTDHRVTPD